MSLDDFFKSAYSSLTLCSQHRKDSQPVLPDTGRRAAEEFGVNGDVVKIADDRHCTL